MDLRPATRKKLLRLLLIERFGPPPYRKRELKDPPEVIADRRRVLVDEEKEPRGA